MPIPDLPDPQSPRAKQIFAGLNLLSWYACVWFAAQRQPQSEIICMGLAALNLLFSRCGLSSALQTRFDRHFFLALGIGLGFDQLALISGLIRIPSAQGDLLLLPLWLLSLWLIFLSALPLYRQLFRAKFLLTAISGALLGPASYFAGEKFGLLFFTSYWSWLGYALFWSGYLLGIVHFLRSPPKITKPRS